MVQLILALSITIGLIWVLRIVLNRMGGRMGGHMRTFQKQEINIRSMQRLDWKRQLVLVEENGFEHLILIGPHHDIGIHSRPSQLKEANIDSADTTL